MRFAMKAVAVAVAAVVMATGTAAAAPPELPAPKSKYKKKIQPSLFGMHVHELSDPSPQVHQKFGAIRIWDNGVRWDEVNTAPGVYDWTLLDQVVANAEATGAQRIMFVLGSTPSWLATDTSVPNYLNAPGANSMPSSLSAWDDWVRAVVSRYKGRIDEYQAWNEVNFASFWSGTVGEMITLTQRSSKIVKQVDPRAEFVTGSAIVRQPKTKREAQRVTKQAAAVSKKSFLFSYLKGLKKRKVKFDAVGMHLYPWYKAGPGDGTPYDRERGVADAQRVLDHLKLKQPMYDTEMAYGNRRNNGWRKKVLSQSTGAAYLAQTYIYGMTNNVPQVYWYGWDDHVLGVDVTNATTGEALQPGIAYNTVLNWMSKAKNGGCVYGRGVTTCAIKQKGDKQYIVFRRTKAKRTYTAPKKWKAKEVCTVQDSCKKLKKNGRVKVGLSPLLLK
ncbi:MAG: endo-1,4-beta-xylanase [Actinobacteria bacterium]|nr:endo-1,4-beta-xylanase [Actinomycetota bacterium]MCO5300551.1 endo-1,4-beta-xylanase [Candidatus Nanopelagicales bacterium]MCB9429271.1 endo-1,4-beta-xylanase [Actinomycetota bacterium]HPE11244.1 endo-1,4-beta-xylanase [Actinomycetota bacterium]HPJ17511.1 endo-1,4-beta-xylanase [Actinomycetota bacterium]